ILLDSGEGVQYQMQRYGYSINKIDVVAVTHPHGDHINGLPGLIQSMYMLGRKKPITIYGSSETIEFVRDTLEVERLDLGFQVRLESIENSGSRILYSRGGDVLLIEWTPSCHSIEAYSFKLTWRLRPRIDPRKLAALGIEDPRLISMLTKEGEIEIDGRRVTLADAALEPFREASLVYTGDTSPCNSIMTLASGARILIHDSSFDSSRKLDALERGHSTAADAAEMARKAGVHLLVLTHVSGRYRGSEARILLDEARVIHSNTLLAWDGMKLIMTI
ncbi:MAG: MBL fold metallo-hydrolase, partial [Desulfurococcales archaeon]|nr:MBL fold metallo-hydrolase [Desulfurococcales archaeon]